MKHNVRLVARGFWGEPSPKALCYNITSKAGYARAKKAGKAVNVLRLLSEGEEDDGKRPLICKWDLVPSIYNTVASWRDRVGSSGRFLTAYKNGFDHGQHVGHMNAEANQPSMYESNGFKVPANGPFYISPYLHNPDKEQDGHLWQARWGKYQFQVREGKLEIMRLLPAWTQTKEDALSILLNPYNPQEDGHTDLTPEQSAQIDQYRKELYADYQTVDLGLDGEDLYNARRTFVFIPDPAGHLYIVRDGAKVAQIPNSDILKTSKEGELWPASNVTVRCSGGAYFWQVGYPQFLPGKLTFGPLETKRWADGVGSVEYNINASKPGGSDVQVEKEVVSEILFGFEMTLTPADLAGATWDQTRRYTPFVRHAQAFINAGIRNGSDSVFWDSDDHAIRGASPVLSIAPQWDGCFRQRSYAVTLWQPFGEMFEGDAYNYNVLENRVCDLYINDEPVITRGIIALSDQSGAMMGTPNLARTIAFGAGAEVTFQIHDQAKIVEETDIDCDPIGDGLFVGVQIRRVLGIAGVKATEVTGVAITEGPGVRLKRIPKPPPGDDPCERPTPGCKALDYIQGLAKDYGLGRIPWQRNDGIWEFEKPYEKVAYNQVTEYQGESSNDVLVPLAFKSSRDDHDPNSYPGRLIILKQVEKGLQMVHDPSDVFNEFLVTGDDEALDENGNPPSYLYRLSNSIAGSGAQMPGVLNHLGRRKRYPAVQNKVHKDTDACYFAARSLSALYSLPGRFLPFVTYYHWFMVPRMLITYDGILCVVESIGGVDSWRDEMQIGARELLRSE